MVLQNPNNPDAIAKFQEMAAAYVYRLSLSRAVSCHGSSKLITWHSYEILSEPDSREAYDRYGMEGLGGGHAGPGGMDPNDIFAELFGGGSGMRFDFGGMGGGMPGGYSRRTKGQDSVIPYEVSLEDLYNGKSVKMMMEKEIICGLCKGWVSQPSFLPLIIFLTYRLLYVYQVGCERER